MAVFFPCSLQYFPFLLGCSLSFLVIFITSSIFILQLPHDSSFCQLCLLSVLFPKFSSHFPAFLFQLSCKCFDSGCDLCSFTPHSVLTVGSTKSRIDPGDAEVVVPEPAPGRNRRIPLGAPPAVLRAGH